MTYLIIGTSNTIRRDGYRMFAETLRPDLPWRIEGVGATPSALVPYILADLALEDVTHVAIDTLINDSVLASDAGSNIQACEAMLFECVEWLQAHGKVVVLLLLPQTNKGEAAGLLRRRRLAFAAARSIQVVDGYAVDEAMRRDFGMDDAQLYTDPQHSTWPISLILGQRLLAAFGAGSATAVAADAGPLPYFVHQLAETAAHQVDRETSLTKRTYAALGEAESLEFHLAAPATLQALALNARETSGILEITSESGSVTQDLQTPHAAGGKSTSAMIHLLLPLDKPLSGQSFRITLRRPDRQKEPVVAEIESALFRWDAVPNNDAAREAEIEVGLAALTEFETPALSPAESAIANAAMISWNQVDTSDAAAFYRRTFARPTPFWELAGHQIAVRIVDFGMVLGEHMAARRILQSALKQFPRVQSLRDRLPDLRDKTRSARTPTDPLDAAD